MNLTELTEMQKRATDALNALSGKICAAAIGEQTLPYIGIPLYSTPFWLYLKEHLIYEPNKSPIIEVMRQACAIALWTPRTECVLICGESGTGKETFAKMFAVCSENKYVAINCTGLPDYLVESELFGHVTGAFTGAISNKRGLFLEAENGVILLDEIGDMPVSLQAKLLRAIQERKIRPVGANKEQPIHCRVVCSTNKRPLQVLREDLYWRISTHTIVIPPLRERPADADIFLQNFDVPVTELDTKCAMNGNYRELQQIVSRYRLRKYLEAAGTPPAI
jgi:transcriptional regulator with PAS, ATPase and Fis domain